MEITAITKPSAKSKLRKKMKNISKNWELYLFVLPAFLTIILFKYVPMYGITIAFKDFIAAKGIWGSEWVGFSHFTQFFHSYYFSTLIKNTLGISLYGLILGFPIPIILALSMNELKHAGAKKIIQTITYAPHFISVVVMAGMLISFLSQGGIINNIIVFFGGTSVSFLMKPSMFKSVYVISEIWQHAGWGTVIYLAALSGIDPSQHEAAIIDGASKFQRNWNIDIPGIMPTMIILLILNVGNIMAVGFEKIFLLQNSANMETSEVISTYVYRCGILQAQYSFSVAVGLFNSIINFILLILVNGFAKKINETSLW